MQFVQIENPHKLWCKVEIATGLVVASSPAPHKAVKKLRRDQWQVNSNTGRISFKVDLSPKKK